MRNALDTDFSPDRQIVIAWDPSYGTLVATFLLQSIQELPCLVPTKRAQGTVEEIASANDNVRVLSNYVAQQMIHERCARMRRPVSPPQMEVGD